MNKKITEATPSDALLCNKLDPPIKGVNVGGGIHVVIPDDWNDKIMNGQDVDGCTYAKVDIDGDLLVSDAVQQKIILNTSDVQQIDPATLTSFETKLNSAVNEGSLTAEISSDTIKA